MEMVLDVYKRQFDPRAPVVCIIPIPASPGQPTKHDYEYCEPLAGKRMVKVTERKTKQDWAYFLEEIADQYGQSEYTRPWIVL